MSTGSLVGGGYGTDGEIRAKKLPAAVPTPPSASSPPLLTTLAWLASAVC